MTDKETELTAQFLDDDNKESRFQISLANLLAIVSLDSRPEHEQVGACKSSQLIMDMGGPEGIAKRLHTSTETGIKFSSQEKADRTFTFGPNSFPPPKIKTLFELVMENFEDQINQILLGAAIVSCIIGLIQHPFPEGMLEGTSIMIALCIIIIVGSGNNYASERRLAKLVAMADKQEVAVYRKGKDDETETIQYEELVVGDLVRIAKGMKVPADCMLVSGQNVSCKEDALTGEPDELEKVPLTQDNFEYKNCIMFAKATVSNGVGAALVLAVGEKTASGVITKKVQEQGEESKPTLLQEKLNSIADQIGKVGYGCALLTFFAICVRLTLEMAGALPCGCKNLATCEEPAVVDGKIQCDVLSFASADNRLYTELLNTIIIAITVIVVAIPEGLPLAVTISLSFSSAKMQKENNLVRNLASAETMGAVTHICSDKTGTLTQNVMTTMACMVHQKSFRMVSDDQPNTQKLANDVQSNNVQAWDLLKECAIWNGDARIEVPAKIEGEAQGYTGVEQPKFEYQGNVTEVGILKFFAGFMGIEEVRNTKLSLTKDKILCTIPFDSKTKRGSTVIQRDDGSVRVYTKGAPDVLFNMVSHAAVPGGEEDWNSTTSAEGFESLAEIMAESGHSSPTHSDIFKACVKDYACQAYRTILMCYKDMSMDEFLQTKADNNDFEKESDRYCLEQGLVAIGIFGIQDPLRETIVASVQKVKEAGIKVIMCTGDNIDTATAISKNAGIVTQADIDSNPKWSRMEGETFRNTVGTIKKITDPNDPKKQIDAVGNQGTFNRVIKHLRVLARSSPEDKYLLVTGLQACPYECEQETELESQITTKSSATNYCSVAVTGDGTNDAPALSKADVGFAMGITGTDVAKGACDIILLDDNFASIITALKYGRNIYDNVRKFLQFQLTVNVVAMFIVFFGSVMLNDSPLTAVQMLWVNLIMDTLAALALATEPPDATILQRMPQPSSKSIVTELMWRNVYGHAIYQMVLLIAILFAAQGCLVEKYDVKCLVTRKAGEQCPEGGMNPFYAGTHYFQLETKEYWTKNVADKSAAINFDADAWARFQCGNLLESYPAAFETELCTKDNFMAKLKELNTEDKPTLENLTDGTRVFTPQKQVEGSGTQKLIHMTYVFQIFVFMQVFNQINARILTEDFNVFSGICANWLFVAVSIFTFVIQMVLVEVGGKVTKTYPLEMWQNGICLAFGSGELIWGALIKFVPVRFFQCFNFEETPMTPEEVEASVLGAFKKGSVRKAKSKEAQKIEGSMGNALLQDIKARQAQIESNQ